MARNKKPVSILGIDPGLYTTGYGFINTQNAALSAFDWGCIRPPKGAEIPEKLKIIKQSILSLMESYQVSAVAVETQFVFKNVNSALKLGMVRGVVLLLAAENNIPVFEYSPATIKKSCTGSGRASKDQIRYMMSHNLSTDHKHISEDAADALAIALCHKQHQAQKELLKPETPQ